MLEYELRVERLDSHGSVASAKQAEVTLDTAMDGRDDA